MLVLRDRLNCTGMDMSFAQAKTSRCPVFSGCFLDNTRATPGFNDVLGVSLNEALKRDAINCGYSRRPNASGGTDLLVGMR